MDLASKIAIIESWRQLHDQRAKRYRTELEAEQESYVVRAQLRGEAHCQDLQADLLRRVIELLRDGGQQ